MCAVDVSEVDDALEYLGCRADVLTLDPRSLGRGAGVDRHGGGAPRRCRHGPLARRARCRHGSTHSALRSRAALRPTVLVLEWTDPPFSAGHWVPDLVTPVAVRRCSPTPAAIPAGSSGTSCGRRAGRSRDRLAVRLPPRRRLPTSVPRSSSGARSPMVPRCGPSTPTATSCGPDPASSTARRSWPASSIPTSWAHPTRRRPAASA